MPLNSVLEIQLPIKSFELYIAEGINARNMKDDSQWRLGDLAGSIDTDYGHDSIGDFAQAIGVEKKTLMNYRTVSSRFPFEIRSLYRVSFSHFAQLTAVKTPEAWLEKSQNEKWTVERLRNEVEKAYSEVKPARLTDDPPNVFSCEKCRKWRLKDMSSFDICRGHYEWKNGKPYYE